MNGGLRPKYRLAQLLVILFVTKYSNNRKNKRKNTAILLLGVIFKNYKMI